ncbi:hypothetical protein ILP97_00885 [Amycolatopsis sp. H6(2020)]|nr:hypothetical protein [Amycolatopsis sp. H6(2020)]
MSLFKKFALLAISLLALALSAAAPASAAAGAGTDREVLAFAPDGGVQVMAAEDCSNPQWGIVCVSVNGSGLFVSRVSGIHVTQPFVQTCNKEFHLWGYYENGTQWHRNGYADCGWGRVWVDFDLNANMRDGSSVCADMKEGTSWHANGFACVTIHR